MKLQDVRETLARWTLPTTRVEEDLQEAIAQVLSMEGVEFVREANLGAAGRVDFLVAGGVAIEVKVEGQWAAVLSQLHRYAGHEDVTAVLLVTTRAKHWFADAEEMHGKPVEVFRVVSQL